MPHGFLSYNFPIWGMRDESMEGIRVGTEWIKELFGEESSAKDLVSGQKIQEKEQKVMKNKLVMEEEEKD